MRAVFMPESESALDRVSVMSRYLNGAGMGFFANAAKFAANGEIWAAGGEQVEAYKAMERQMATRARSVGGAPAPTPSRRAPQARPLTAHHTDLAQEHPTRAPARVPAAKLSIVRAGTLKGGAIGDAISGDGGGDKRFLNTYFYQLGQQDVVNWRLLFDCDALGVELVRPTRRGAP